MEQALSRFVDRENLHVHGFLSRKPTGVVIIVSSQDNPHHKWIVRVSKWTSNHSTYNFCKAWNNHGRAFLPGIQPPRRFEFRKKTLVFEQYEYIGTPPPDTEINRDGEVPSNFLSDLFQVSIEVGPHKSLKLLHKAACGLAALHNEDWAHLDFSLENVACAGDRVVLIDFEATLQKTGFATQTEVGKSCKKMYAAPEVVRGNTLVSPSAIDVWAFGVALFLTITHDYVFKVKNAQGATISRTSLYRYVLGHGFRNYLQEFKPKLVDVISWYPHLIDLLEGIFIVYVKQYSDGFGQEIFTPPDGQRDRLTAEEICNHPFWEPYLRDEIRDSSEEKPQVVSKIVVTDPDCQLRSEDVHRGASWFMTD